MDPIDESNLAGSGPGIVIIVPAIEIDAPANGAVYNPGQVVHASWGCGYYGTAGLGASGCKGTVADGSAIDTRPGRHTFTISGFTTDANGTHTVTATVTYTVGAAPVSITTAKINSAHHTAEFTFKAAGSVAGFQCALVKRSTNGSYPRPSFSSCHSPKTYRQLKGGRYRFEARSLEGSTHGAPASRSFKIT